VLDDRGRVLLARRAVEPDAGLWDTPGGFLDEGEEPEHGLLRELREEAGVDVELRDFVGIFADRYGEGVDAPFVLNLVWNVEIVRGEPEPADDVSELRWFDSDDLPAADELAFTWLERALGEAVSKQT
jgi:8-oxo-dGTP diphosphatase